MERLPTDLDEMLSGSNGKRSLNGIIGTPQQVAKSGTNPSQSHPSICQGNLVNSPQVGTDNSKSPPRIRKVKSKRFQDALRNEAMIPDLPFQTNANLPFRVERVDARK